MGKAQAPVTDLFGMAKVQDVVSWIKDKGVEPLYLCVTGSHMWGLNGPDSDLDIRGVYIIPTQQVLSLRPPRDTIEAVGALDGNVDLQLYEVGKALKMLLNNNGNIVEMLLAPTAFYHEATAMVDWRVLSRKFLTRRLVNHFRGYYHSQRKHAAANRGSKALAYCYRELMVGTWLLRTGLLVYDFAALRRFYQGVYGPVPLLDQYLERENWRKPMSAGAIWEFEQDWARLEAVLESEVETSPLPEQYDGFAEMDALLLRLRRDYWTLQDHDDADQD